MKYTTLKFGKILIIALSALLLSQTAGAGYKWRHEVAVSSSYASGGKRAALLSSDSTQYIGCNFSVTGAATGDVMACFARNKAGAYFYCYASGSSAANLVSALESASDYSYLAIGKNSNGTCRSLTVSNHSANL